MPNVPKPAHLAVRGGCWFEDGPAKVHLGVEADFRPARKAHPALLVDDLDGSATRSRRLVSRCATAMASKASVSATSTTRSATASNCWSGSAPSDRRAQ